MPLHIFLKSLVAGDISKEDGTVVSKIYYFDLLSHGFLFLFL